MLVRMLQDSARHFSQWESFDAKRLTVSCCDCGVVHVWQLAMTKDGRVLLRTRRHKGKTRALRKRKFKVTC